MWLCINLCASRIPRRLKSANRSSPRRSPRRPLAETRPSDAALQVRICEKLRGSSRRSHISLAIPLIRALPILRVAREKFERNCGCTTTRTRLSFFFPSILFITLESDRADTAGGVSPAKSRGRMPYPPAERRELLSLGALLIVKAERRLYTWSRAPRSRCGNGIRRTRRLAERDPPPDNPAVGFRQTSPLRIGSNRILSWVNAAHGVATTTTRPR